MGIKFVVVVVVRPKNSHFEAFYNNNNKILQCNNHRNGGKMKTVTCNNCHKSFQVLESSTLPTCPNCGALVFLPDQVYMPVSALEKYERERKRRQDR